MARNGEIVATSGEGYRNASHARAMAERILPDVDFLEIDDSTPLTAGEADAIRALLTRHPRQETPE